MPAELRSEGGFIWVEVPVPVCRVCGVQAHRRPVEHELVLMAGGSLGVPGGVGLGG